MQKSRLFVGNLLDSVSREDLEYEFSEFGVLKDVWVAQNPRGFAFVEYEDEDDANDAVSNMNGKEYFGSRIKVEVSRQRPSGRRSRGGISGLSNGRSSYDREGDGRRISRGSRDGYEGRGHDGYDSCDDNYHSSHPRKGHSSGGRSQPQFTRLYIGNLLEYVSCEDLEDEFSEFGALKDVWVAQNYPFFAFVEYEDEDDAQDAISYMDGKEYFGSRIKVEVSRQRPSGRRGRGGSYAFSQPQFTRLYIGNILEDVSCEELEYECSIFGALKDVWVAPNRSGFAFVEYEDEDDAKDAVSNMNGEEYFGSSQPQFTRLYIGNLLEYVSCEDLEDEFSEFGALKDVWVAQNYPFFAFVEYEDEDDAQDAISYMDGKEYFGSRIKVEVSRQRPSGRRGRGGSYAFSNGCGGSDREGGGRRISRGDHKGYGVRGHDCHDSDDSCDDNCHSTDHRKVHSGGGRSNGCGGSDREGGGRRISRGDHKGYGGRGHDGHDSDDSCDDNCHSTDHRKFHSGGGRSNGCGSSDREVGGRRISRGDHEGYGGRGHDSYDSCDDNYHSTHHRKVPSGGGRRLAEDKKDEGNKYYKQRDFRRALCCSLF